MEAKWEPIAAELRHFLARGRWLPGDRLPSEPELQERFDVSRGPVHRAMLALQDEGLIDDRRRVTSRDPLKIRITLTESVTWAADMRRLGRVPAVEISISVIDDKLVRHVLRLVDDEPHNYSDWEFPLSIAQDTRLMSKRDIPGGSVAYLRTIGVKNIRQDEPWVTARMPRPEEIRELLMPARGQPVLEEYRTGRQGDTVIYRARRIFRGDRTDLVLPTR